jgi:hypothetical protein
LKLAPTQEGIYSTYLQKLYGEIRNDTGLVEAYKTVINTAPEGVVLDPIHTFLLDSLGLVSKKENQVISRCSLYKKYFLGVL